LDRRDYSYHHLEETDLTQEAEMFREIRESLGRINPIKIDTNKENYSLTNKIKWLKNDSLLRKKRRASDKITVSH